MRFASNHFPCASFAYQANGLSFITIGNTMGAGGISYFWIDTKNLGVQSFEQNYREIYQQISNPNAYPSLANYQGPIKFAFFENLQSPTEDALFAATERLPSFNNQYKLGPSSWSFFVRLKGPGGIPSDPTVAGGRCLNMSLPSSTMSAHTKWAFVIAMQAKSVDVVYVMHWEDYDDLSHEDYIVFSEFDFSLN